MKSLWGMIEGRIMHYYFLGTIWVHHKRNYINSTQNRIKMIWFTNVKVLLS